MGKKQEGDKYERQEYSFWELAIVFLTAASFTVSLYFLWFGAPILVTFCIGISSLSLSVLIYKKSHEQVRRIHRSTSQLQRAIEGSGSGFSELFNKLQSILSGTSHIQYDQVEYLVPSLSFGSVNRGTYEDGTYREVQECLSRLIGSDTHLNIIIYDFIPSGADKSSQSQVEKYLQKINNATEGDMYITNWSHLLHELFSSVRRTAKQALYNGSTTTNIFLANDILICVVSAGSHAVYESMFFFIEDETLQQMMNTEDSRVGKDRIHEITYHISSISEAARHTSESLLQLQKNKYSDGKKLFNTYDPLHILHTSNNICSVCTRHSGEVLRNKARSITYTSLKSNQYNEWGRVTSEESSCRYYIWDSREVIEKPQEENLLVVPSAAGLYTYFADEKNFNEHDFRFNMYASICSDLASENVNVILLSPSGLSNTQDEEYGEVPYSCEQLADDITQIFTEFGIDISGALGFCTGAIGLVRALQQSDSLDSAIPLVCWDVPSRVGWEENRSWFENTFPHIKIDTPGFERGVEPVDCIPDYTENILYMNTQNSMYANQFEEITNILSSKENSQTKNFDMIAHIPSKGQSSEEYDVFLSSVEDHIR